MIEFEYKGKLFHNPVEFVLNKLGGTWKIPILWNLNEKKMRYGELQRSLNGVSSKMLTMQLRELEQDGFIDRKVFPVIPPHTEYSITEKGERVIPLIKMMRDYGIKMLKEEGIEIKRTTIDD
ncbi:MAG: helix-turn-helix transcriptional regulator [Leptospiraceae bacterium]|nr:helix-turn-helix transcriptional regulator [Leptospiraceae bacterium]MCP5495874.1 helix-turn-helix transcriptional regulator [Leptospiraceae bacterium]